MPQGKVTVNNLNLAQGSFPEIERKALFIGVGSKNNGSVMSLNTQSDLDDLLGVGGSAIKLQVQAAKANGGENWEAFAAPHDGAADWRDVLDAAMEHCSPELVVVCSPAEDAAALNDAQAKMEEMRTTKARRMICLIALPSVNRETQTWSDYEAATIAIQNGVAAYRVCAVPLLHENDLGVLAGRLCNQTVSIADSPMRVATGPVIGLGGAASDSSGATVPDSTLANLSSNRLTCVQRYVDYPGVYFADAHLLDIPAGDYQVIENLRVVDKAARAVRLLAIAQIANRSINSTPASIEYTQKFFTRPLREMSQGTEFNGIPFPGEIKKPKDDAIQVLWPTKNKLEVYIKLVPYNSPKEITANLLLDLSND